MDHPVPTILSPTFPPNRLSGWHRLFCLALGLVAAAVLVHAAMLEPATKGVGTHVQLALQPCQFLARTGQPCPTCGMTTAFAWFAQGRPLASLNAQPVGFILAVATAALFWISMYAAVTAKPVHRLIPRVSAPTVVLVVAIALGLGWAYKVLRYSP